MNSAYCSGWLKTPGDDSGGLDSMGMRQKKKIKKKKSERERTPNEGRHSFYLGEKGRLSGALR